MFIIKPSHEVLTPIDEETVYQAIERAGRTAYKSEDKISPGSAKKFIANIIKRGHESVLEHYNVSVRVICDRGVSHEIVRHRLMGITQESTRYCNYGQEGITVIAPDLSSAHGIIWLEAMKACEAAYLALIRSGTTPQIARSVLPNSLKTELVLTANIREWRHILKLRTAADAHPQMRELMVPILMEFCHKLPALFLDIAAAIAPWRG